MLPFEKGDVIIFKAEDEWLSKAIAWLTDSDVSHAAMVYSDTSIVEAGAGGIVISNTRIAAGDAAYVMRLTGAPDSAPLIRSADNYLNARVRYDFPELFLLAGLLLYKKLPLSSRLLPICGRIFAVVAYELDEFIKHRSKHPDVPAMVCSQLVYQIFYDCGGEYRIKIENGTFACDKVVNAGNTMRLIDLLEDYSANAEDASDSLSAPDSSYGKEALARELYEALTAAEDSAGDAAVNASPEDTSPEDTSHEGSPADASALPPAVLSHTLKYAELFLSKLKDMLADTGSSLAPESMFITPADLVYHAVNLNQEGVIALNRIK